MLTVNEVKLVYTRRRNYHPADQRLDNPHNVANFIRKKYRYDIEVKEMFWVILLDSQLNTLGYSTLFEGGVDQCTVDPKILFATVIKSLASRFIIVHNHPSGCPLPSSVDNAITSVIDSGAKILKVELLDHVIVASKSHYSYKSEKNILK